MRWWKITVSLYSSPNSSSEKCQWHAMWSHTLANTPHQVTRGSLKTSRLGWSSSNSARLLDICFLASAWAAENRNKPPSGVRAMQILQYIFLPPTSHSVLLTLCEAAAVGFGLQTWKQILAQSWRKMEALWSLSWLTWKFLIFPQ